MTATRMKGYEYCKEFENAIKEFELKVDYGIDIEENFKNLNEKRIDCFAIQDFFTAPMFIIGKLNKTQFKTIPYQSCKQTLYFGFSKKSPAKGIIPQNKSSDCRNKKRRHNNSDNGI